MCSYIDCMELKISFLTENTAKLAEGKKQTFNEHPVCASILLGNLILTCYFSQPCKVVTIMLILHIQKVVSLNYTLLY